MRHPTRITDALGEFSYKITRAVPALVYDGSNAHTTIVAYGIRDNFVPDSGVLESISAGMHNVKPRLAASRIKYQEWLFNQDSVIVGGIPDEMFWDIGRNTVDSLKKEGINARSPWGAHITASRFTEARYPDELAGFLDIMENAPFLGYSVPFNLDVGILQSPEKFHLETYERFTL